VQVMPDPLEALFAKALGLEHFADAAQARKTHFGFLISGGISMFCCSCKLGFQWI
jgi:hypothetical protein